MVSVRPHGLFMKRNRVNRGAHWLQGIALHPHALYTSDNSLKQKKWNDSMNSTAQYPNLGESTWPRIVKRNGKGFEHAPCSHHGYLRRCFFFLRGGNFVPFLQKVSSECWYQNPITLYSSGSESSWTSAPRSLSREVRPCTFQVAFSAVLRYYCLGGRSLPQSCQETHTVCCIYSWVEM